jgi:RecG-like helicase
VTSVADAASVPEACDANLGPRQRHRRLVGGFLGTGVTLVVLVLLVALHASRGWRLLLFAPFAFAAIGYLQYAARTCVHLAVRGLRNLDAGDEKLTDFTVRLALRRRARKLVLASLGLAALGTFVAYVL